MDDPVTEDLVAEWAEGTLACWMTSYTDPLSDGRQRKVVQLEDDTYQVYRVEDFNGYHPDRVFRVSVQVEEVKQ